MESIIGIVLVFPLGIWVGYKWRDRISQRRRALHKAERFVRETIERRSRRDVPNISDAIGELLEIKNQSSGND